MGVGMEEKMEALKYEKEGWGVSFDKSKRFSLAIFWYNVSWLVVNFF